MHKRFFGFFGVLLSLVFILSACDVQSSTSGTTTNAQGTPIAPNSANALGTPTATVSSGAITGSPAANMPTTDLATAFSNLESQNSYVMTVKLTNVQGGFAEFAGNLSDSTLKIERNGENRHLTVMNASDKTVFQLWKVNGNVYADIGKGPTQISTNGLLGRFANMMNYDQMIVQSFEDKDASYEALGTANVNDVQTTVEGAKYQLKSRANNSFFQGMFSGTINSKIWVAQSGNYLLKADFMLNSTGNAAALGTPVTGSSSTSSEASPTANGSAQVTLDVSQINSAPQITAPTGTSS